MYCSKCGAQIPDGSRHCNMCGAAIPDPLDVRLVPPTESVPNYLVGSILVTLFCCMPFGVIGIVYAATANSKLAAGDVRGALAAADSAKKFTWWGFWIGLIATLIWGSCSLIPFVLAAAGQ